MMRQPVLTLELPEDVYERLRRAAKGMNRPMEKALVEIVRAATPTLEKVPVQFRADLDAMEDLGDSTLLKIANTTLGPAKERRMARLLEKNQRGALTNRDSQVLAELRAEGDRLVLKRSYAILLLKYRGHPLPKPEGL